MEHWKDIKGYENMYQVSTYGRVRSLKFNKIRILKQSVAGDGGYLKVIVFNNGKLKTFRIHRLVVEAFILNPYNKLEINHKDGNGLNNNVLNLEWSTKQENVYHSRNISKNGTVISLKKIKELYSKHRDLHTYDFVKLLISSCK